MSSVGHPVPAPEPSDAELLAAVAHGQISALGSLYDRYQGSVHRFIARLTTDAHDVEDLVHVTFLTAAKAAASFDGRASCRPWLLGVAARLVSRRKRSLGRLSRALRELGFREYGRHEDPHRELMARDDLSRLRLAIADLSEAKRVVLLLAEVEGLSSEEIASALAVPVGTVWRRLHQARVELRRDSRVER